MRDFLHMEKSDVVQYLCIFGSIMKLVATFFIGFALACTKPIVCDKESRAYTQFAEAIDKAKSEGELDLIIYGIRNDEPCIEELVKLAENKREQFK